MLNIQRPQKVFGLLKMPECQCIKLQNINPNGIYFKEKSTLIKKNVSQTYCLVLSRDNDSLNSRFTILLEQNEI